MSQMTICLILFILTLIGFAVGSSYVSIAVISLISMMLLVLTGCLEPAVALSGFSNGSAILMASMFIVAAGLNRTQMVNKISSYICRISKGSFTKVLAGYVLLTCILAQFIPSAVVCFSIVFPMALGVCREMNVNPSKMMFSLGITAIGTVITLPLSSAIQEMARIQGFLEAYEYTQYNMTIFDITKAKFPVMVAIVLVSIFLIPRFSPDVKNEKEISASGPKQAEPLDPVREVIGYVTFILVLLYVGALGIGNALSATGAADLVGDKLSTIIVTLNNNYLAGLLFFLVPFILTQFMLNLGIYSIFVPLYIMICKSMGTNPIGPIMLCMIASMTAFFSPLATAAVPVMMGAGNYHVKDLVKMGALPAVIISVVAVGWIMTIYPIF